MSFIKFNTKTDVRNHLDRIASYATIEQLDHAARVLWLGLAVNDLFDTDADADNERLRKLETVALRAAKIID
jgi:hypothetical protein